jgi:hypothetical protein
MCGKRRSQHNWGTISNFLAGLRKTTRNLSQDRRCPGWDANREPPECKRESLLLDPTCVTSCVDKTRLERSELAQATTVRFLQHYLQCVRRCVLVVPVTASVLQANKCIAWIDRARQCFIRHLDTLWNSRIKASFVAECGHRRLPFINAARVNYFHTDYTTRQD